MVGDIFCGLKLIVHFNMVSNEKEQSVKDGVTGIASEIKDVLNWGPTIREIWYPTRWD